MAGKAVSKHPWQGTPVHSKLCTSSATRYALPRSPLSPALHTFSMPDRHAQHNDASPGNAWYLLVGWASAGEDPVPVCFG